MITVRATAGFFPFFFFLDCKVQGCDFFFLKEGNGEAKAQSQNNENQEANDTGEKESQKIDVMKTVGQV